MLGKKLLVVAAAMGMVAFPLAVGATATPASSAGHHASAAAPGDGPTAAEMTQLRHVTAPPKQISPEAAQKIKEGAQPKSTAGLIAGADEWTTPWATWNPDGLTQYVRMHVYLDYASDGKLHDFAWGEAYLYHESDEVYVDISNTAGGNHWPWQAYRGDTWTGDSRWTTRNSWYDGPGYWVRVCGASFGYGDPWGSPQWGWNINCTAWN